MTRLYRGLIAISIALTWMQVQATGPDYHSVGLRLWDDMGGTPVKEVLIGHENTGFLAGDLYYVFSETSLTVSDTFVPWCGIMDCSGLPLHLEITGLAYPAVTGITFTSSLQDMTEAHTATSIKFTWTNVPMSSPDVFLSARWINAIPEPSTFAMNAGGLVLLCLVAARRWRRNR